MTNQSPRQPKRTMKMVGQRPRVFTIESQTRLKLRASQIQRMVKSTQAQSNLAVCYYFEKDYAEAVRWWRKAAEQGHAQAQNWLGFCHYYGQGVKKDYAEAVRWFSMSAEQGYDKAQNWLGFCYYHGQGVEKDNEEAVRWFRKAAAQGHSGAKDYLNKLNAD